MFYWFIVEPVLHDRLKTTDRTRPNFGEHDRHDDNDKNYLIEFDRNFNYIIFIIDNDYPYEVNMTDREKLV